ncbi:MAG: biotin transporter BioY [Ruminiclostridium sp.]|nr:biotin transporter BioY [Ruminiclostridium sp.]
MNKSKIKTADIVFVGVFAAVLAVLSQISIPLPLGVPVTLQTFAVALCGYFLGWKKGLAAVLVYILLAAVGVPVLAGFCGGFSYILGLSGGFIYGFLFLAALCGLNLKHKVFKIAAGCGGLLLCHLCGLLQYGLIAGEGFVTSFLLVSAPFLIKDIVSVVLAYFCALVILRAVKGRITAMG